MPVAPRDTPPVVQAARHPDYADANKALCVITNIYDGMENVEPGEIKWLRINEAIPRYWDTGRRWNPSNSSSSWKAALWPRVQWGVVPVEPDGSAAFEAPANRNIFFQALDKDFMEVQRERTYVNYQPGETRACVGCHGRNNHAAGARLSATTQAPLALRRPPSQPQPQPCDLRENGGNGLARQVIHYPTDIQPIFDAECVRCHGADEPAGGLRLTNEVTAFYNTSYEQLAIRQLAGPIVSEFTSFQHGDQGNYSGATVPPKTLGSYNSVLMDMIRHADHPKNTEADHSTMLDENQRMILSRWVDSNYQFYGSYYGRQHIRWMESDPANAAYNPTDFRRKPLFEEAISPRAPEWHR